MTGRRIFYFLAIAAAFAVILTASILIADYVSESEIAQKTVQEFGYLGILLISIVGGFNLLVPIPSAAFAPTFLAAGFPALGVIAALAVGTTLADLASYYVGSLGKYYSGVEESKMYQRICKLRQRNRKWVVPFIFAYAAFAPYPNEVMIVPLAFIGMRIRTFILPVLIGNIIFNTILVLGLTNLLDSLF